MDKVWTIFRILDNENVYQCSDKKTAEHEFKRANKNNRFKLELRTRTI